MNAVRPTQQLLNLPMPQGFTPEGVSLALFDEQTLYLVEHALPSRYQGMLAHLLSYGTIDPKTTMQPSLFAATGKSNDEAIILYQSVHALSQSSRSQWGPETYHKGILVYERLKIIRRVFHRNYTELRVPLGKREIHVPALLQGLRELYEEYDNNKVKRLAIRVAKNLKSGEVATSTPLNIAPEMKGALTQLLQEHGIEECKIKPLSLHMACNSIVHTIQTGQAGKSVPPEKGECPREHTTPPQKRYIKKGDSKHQQEEFAVQVDRQESDQQETTRIQKGEFEVNESPRSVTMHRKSRHCHYAKEVLDEIFALESPDFVSKPSQSPSLGDSHATVSIIGQYPSDILSQKKDTIIDVRTETRHYEDTRAIEEIRQEARQYESLFDNKRYHHWTGSLINVLRETPPEAKQYAAIATLFYSYFPLADGRFVNTPGGFFTNTCKRYRQPHAHIPAEVQAWGKSGQSLQAIKDALEQGIRHPAHTQHLSSDRHDDHQEKQETQTQSEEICLLSMPRRTISQQPRRTWMTHDDALSLLCQGRCTNEPIWNWSPL